MSRFGGSSEVPSAMRSPPTRRATMKPYAASVLGAGSSGSPAVQMPVQPPPTNSGPTGYSFANSKAPAARSPSPNKKKPFVFSIKNQKDGFGTPPPLPALSPPLETAVEHSEGAHASVSNEDDSLHVLSATYWLKLHRMSPRWLNLTMALWGIVVADANRSVDAAGVRSFIEAMEWRMNGDVTEGEFLTIYCEWINIGSSVLPKRHAIGLHSFRSILFEKKVPEDSLNLFICLLLNENSRTLLNLPLSYRPSGSLIIPSMTSNLEVCSRKWLALSEELFFALDTAGYGGLQYDQMFFLASSLAIGLRSWTNESEAAADLSVSMLTAIASNLIRDALPSNTSIVFSNGPASDVNKPKPSNLDPHSEPMLMAPSLCSTVTLPTFKKLLIKLGIGESSLEGLINHLRRCIDLVASTLARWSEDSWNSQATGIFVPKADSSFILKSCFPIESAPVDWNAQMTPPGPPRLWQHVVLKVAGSSPSAVSTQNHSMTSAMGDNTGEGLPFVLSFLMSEGDRAVSMAWRAHGEGVSGIDAQNPSAENPGSILVHTAAWKIFRLYRKLGGFPNVATTSGVEPKSGVVPPLDVRRDPIYQLILATLLEYKSLQLALSTALVEAALDNWGTDTSIRAAQEADTHSSVVALACASLVPNSESLLKEIQNYEKAHLPPPPNTGRRFSMSAVSSPRMVESLSHDFLMDSHNLNTQDSAHRFAFENVTETENVDKSNNVQATPFSSGGISHLFSPVEDGSNEANRETVSPQDVVTAQASSAVKTADIAQHLQDILDGDASLPSSWKDIAANANWQTPASSSPMVPSITEHDGDVVEEVEERYQTDNNDEEYVQNKMESVMNVDNYEDEHVVYDDNEVHGDHFVHEDHVVHEDPSTYQSEVIEASPAVESVGSSEGAPMKTDSEDMNKNLNDWLQDDKNSFLTPDEKDVLARLMNTASANDHPPAASSSMQTEAPVNETPTGIAVDRRMSLLHSADTVPVSRRSSSVEAFVEVDAKHRSAQSSNNNTPASSSANSSVSSTAPSLPAAIHENNFAGRDYIDAYHESHPVAPAQSDLNHDHEVGSTASSLVELLQQGHSAGVYAQSLRDLLRKMSRKNSKMQLKSLEDVIRLGENILESESRARGEIRSRSPAAAPVIGSRSFETNDRANVHMGQTRNASPNRRSSQQTHGDAPPSADARRSLMRSHSSNGPTRSYQIDKPPSIIKSVNVETVKSPAVRNFMSPGPESVSSNRSGMSAKPLAAQASSTPAPAPSRYASSATPLYRETGADVSGQVSRTPGRTPGRTPPSPSVNGSQRVIATKSRAKPPPKPTYAQIRTQSMSIAPSLGGGLGAAGHGGPSFSSAAPPCAEDLVLRLRQLGAWPDKRLIFDATGLCARNIRFADLLVDIIVGYIADPGTSLALMVPLFYLLDSIIKNVSGPYIALFATHIARLYQRIFKELNDKDQARLDFLLSTWEEGGLFPAEVLLPMRTCVGTRLVCVRPAPGSVPPHIASAPMGGGGNMPRGLGGPGQLPYAVLLQREMGFLLDQIYKNEGFRDPIPLDQLSIKDPGLYHQLRRDAERNLAAGTPASGAAGQRIPGGAANQPFRGGAAGGPASSGANIMQRAGGAHLQEPNDEFIEGAIAGVKFPLNMSRAQRVHQRLVDWSDLNDTNEADRDPALLLLREKSLGVASRLDCMIKESKITPAVPTYIRNMTSGDSAAHAGGRGHEVSALASAVPSASSSSAAAKKLPMPPFRAEDLKRNPMRALRSLYADRPFYSQQDGLRFKSQQNLGAHLDALFVRNKDKRAQQQGLRNSRLWYLSADQWVTDCGALGGSAQGGASSRSGGASESGFSGGAGGSSSEEEMVVPADEAFPRCPVSHEVFVTFWDNEEGDYMYRNAVRVLLTESADASLYKLAQPTSLPGVKYILVHKGLVLDRWLEAGRAVTVQSAMTQRRLHGASSGLPDYAAADGVDEEESDVFVLMPPLGEMGGPPFDPSTAAESKY